MLNKTGLFSHSFLGAGSVSSALIHVTDWLPTFYSAAGGSSGIASGSPISCDTLLFFTYYQESWERLMELISGMC